MSKEQEVINNFLKVAATGKDLEQITSEVNDKKSEKAGLERDIIVLKNSVSELKNTYAHMESDKKGEELRLNKIISNLIEEKDRLLNSMQLEKNELASLKEKHDRIENELSVKSAMIDGLQSNLNRDRVEVNAKIDIVNQIALLAEGL